MTKFVYDGIQRRMVEVAEDAPAPVPTPAPAPAPVPKVEPVKVVPVAEQKTVYTFATANT